MNIHTLINNVEKEYEELEPGILNENSKFKEVIYWNSMNSLIMIVMIEFEYGVLIKEEDLKRINTIRELSDYISEKTVHEQL